MPTGRGRATFAALLLVLAGCGGGAGSPDPAQQVGQPRAAAHLRVVQHQTACCYIEGQVSFLTLAEPGGEVVVDRVFTALGLRVAALDLDLDAGRYELHSWQRSCVASCPDDLRTNARLDAVSNECRATVEVTIGGRTELVIAFAPGPKPCTIAPGPLPVDVPDEVALRPEAQRCGTLVHLVTRSPTRTMTCLRGVARGGKIAETYDADPASAPEPRHWSIIQMDALGVVVYRKVLPDGPWDRGRCSGIEETDEGSVALVGCTAPELLPLVAASTPPR